MKPFFLTIAFLFLLLHSFAQYENFDLSKYRLPEMTRHQLDFNFDSEGNFRSNFSNDSLIETYYGIEVYEQKYNKIEDGANLQYSFYRNSNKLQASAEGNFSSNYMREKNRGFRVSETNERFFGNAIEASSDFKIFNPQNWFLNLSPEFSLSGSKLKSLNGGNSDEERTNSRTSAELLIGGGKGRIEQVQDFRHAILLLQELDGAGLKRDLTEAEVYELSVLISELKNERFFDSRIRKKKDLTAIDSFLVEKGVVSENNEIAYFVGLEDIWEFGALQVRESGNQVRFLAGPEYYKSRSKYGDNDENKLEQVEIHAALDYFSRKPISLKWQRIFDVGLNYLNTDNLVKENISTGSTKHYSQAYTTINFGFFPNTRTSMFMWGRAELNNWSYGKILEERIAFRFSSGFSVNYYISAKLRLSGYTNFRHEKDGLFNENTIEATSNRFSYGLYLNYAIF
jgi:hypothetical protein